MRFKYLFLSLFLIFALLHAPLVFAQVRSSTNYQIQSDSINIGGGLSSSTNFVQESTVGEIATGKSDSASYSLRAGYQQMQEVYLALSAATDVVMSPSLGGVTGGVSNGSTSVIATTDSSAGYQLTVQAINSPAMRSGPNNIADYVPQGANPDASFLTSATSSHFAFSPFGTDIVSRFKVDGSTCGSGVSSTTACWDGLTTSPATIAQSTSPNHPSGATTTIYFKVGIGGNVTQPEGVYVATTTVTLLSL